MSPEDFSSRARINFVRLLIEQSEWASRAGGAAGHMADRESGIGGRGGAVREGSRRSAAHPGGRAESEQFVTPMDREDIFRAVASD